MAIITQVSETAVFLVHFGVKWGVGGVHRCADVSAHFEVYYNALQRGQRNCSLGAFWNAIGVLAQCCACSEDVCAHFEVHY